MLNLHHLQIDPLLLAAIYGLGLGTVGGSALSIMSPFSRSDGHALEATLLLIVFGVLAAGGGAYVLESWTTSGIVAGTFLAGLGVGIFVLLRSRKRNGPRDTYLSPEEIWRPKTRDDCWILVTGSEAAGKTTLIEHMTEAAAQARHLRQAECLRIGEDRGVHVVELPLRTTTGGRTKLRFWERQWKQTGEPAPADLDGVVMVIDPTSVRGAAESFPEALKVKNAPEVDVATRTIALDASLAKAGRKVEAWHIITKADLLRFSIKDSLVNLVKAGPGWHEQLKGFTVVGRRDLVTRLGVDTSKEWAALDEGLGSPFLAYKGRDASGSDAFGGSELLSAIIETLARDALWQRG